MAIKHNTAARHAYPTHHIPVVSLSVAILLAAALMRMARLNAAPLYLDESTHTWWAQQIVNQQANWTVGVEHNKVLFPIVFSLLHPVGPESPFLGRIVSVLGGVLSAAACIGMGRLLDEDRTGLLAGLLYALLPMAVFHERQALVDPLMGALTTLSLVFMLWLVKRPNVWTALLLGVTLGAAYLAKIPAEMFFALPFAAALLLAPRDRLIGTLILSALAVGVAFVTYRAVYYAAAREGVTPVINQATESRIRLFALGSPQTLVDIRRDASNMADFTAHYVGWLAVGLTALSLIWVAGGQRRRALLFLWIPAVAYTLVWLLLKTEAYTLPARYFTSTPAPLMVLIAVSVRLGWSAWRLRWPRSAVWAGSALLALLVIPWLSFDMQLIRDVNTAPLARGDEQLYVTGYTAGQAYQDAADYLLSVWRSTGKPVDTLMYGGYFWEVSAALGPRVGESTWLKPNNGFQSLDMARWLAAGDSVYLLQTNYGGTIHTGYAHGATFERVRTFVHHDVTLMVYRVTGARGPLATLITNDRAPDAARLANSYSALAADLRASPPDATLVLPPDHADTLAALGVPGVVPFEARVWPLTVEAAQRWLDGQSYGGAQRIAVVQVDPDQLDPARAFSLALLSRLYREGETWYGQVNLTRYVAGPAAPALAPSDAQWEHAISLDGVAIVDPAPSPGGVVRIALCWQTSVPVQDVFSVFTHVVDANGTLVAQYDSVPGGGGAAHDHLDAQPAGR